MNAEDALCFEKTAFDRTIKLDTSMHDFKFTRRWFLRRNIITWSTYLRGKYNNNTPMRMIQIGVFEGMDLIWCLQNILGHPDSHVIAIDPWEPTTKLDAEFMQACNGRAMHNLSPWEDKVTLIRGHSQQVLPQINLEGQIDLVIIDGDHNRVPVLADAVNALRLLKPGGWMVFDDVRNRIPKADHVKHGIESFLGVYSNHVELAWKHRHCDCYEKL